MKAAHPDEEVRPIPAAWIRRAFVATALVAFLPSLPGWRLAWNYHQIPRLVVAPVSSFHETRPGAPPLLGAEAIVAARDGTLVVADWSLRHVLVVAPGSPPRWLPPAGRFRPAIGPRGELHLLDVDGGVLYRFSTGGQLERRVAVAPPGSWPAFCLDASGRAVVAAAGTIVRWDADLGGPDPTWRPSTIPAAAVVGLAADGNRVLAASSDGLRIFSSDGALLSRRRLVGNAGALAVASDGRVVLADRQTGRLFLLDGDGRTLARFVTSSGVAPVRSPAGLAMTVGGRLAVASGEAVQILDLPELP